MEDYIRTHANAAANMAEYKQQILLSKCHPIRYANIKKWFLAMYPEVPYRRLASAVSNK